VPHTNVIIEIRPVHCLHYIIKEYCISYNGRVDILCRQNHGDCQFENLCAFNFAILPSSSSSSESIWTGL